MASKFKDQTSRCGLSRKLISEKIPHNGARGLRVERGRGLGLMGCEKRKVKGLVKHNKNAGRGKQGLTEWTGGRPISA